MLLGKVSMCVIKNNHRLNPWSKHSTFQGLSFQIYKSGVENVIGRRLEWEVT